MKLCQKTPQKVDLEMNRYEAEWLQDCLKTCSHLAPEDETQRNRFLMAMQGLENKHD